ncbi:MAG: hypothetical protein IJ834_00155 [Paludibacteraceae bacterium]|nr:hypothetical protein [Paludibacteraceae bacterium]
MKFLFILLTVFTTYTKGTYHSEGVVQIEQTKDSVNQVVDHFAYDLQTDILRLFDWAFIGTGDQKSANDTVENEEVDEKNSVQLRYKETFYDPATRYGYVIVDVIVPKFHTFKNMKISSLYTDSITQDGVRHARIDIDYSGSLLKVANGTFHVRPISEKLTELQLDLNVRFGFFFNWFITLKTYKNLLEWRLDTIIGNMKQQAEEGRVTDRRPPLE